MAQQLLAVVQQTVQQFDAPTPHHQLALLVSSSRGLEPEPRHDQLLKQPDRQEDAAQNMEHNFAAPLTGLRYCSHVHLYGGENELENIKHRLLFLYLSKEGDKGRLGILVFLGAQ